MSKDLAPLHAPQAMPPHGPENPNYVRSQTRHHGNGLVSIDGSVLFEWSHHHLRMNPPKEPKK